MQLTRLFQAATLRLAILTCLAVTLSTAGVFGFIYLRISALDLNRIEVVLKEEMSHALAQPIDLLKQELDARVASDLRHIDYAALFGSDGRYIFGNVHRLPKQLAIGSKSPMVKVLPIIAESIDARPGVFVVARRPDGNIVLLGRRLYEVYALQHLVLQVLLIGLIPAAILALITGFLVSARSARRLTAINQTIRRIIQGNLSERLPTPGSMDDINHITSSVNLMLDEIVHLVEQIRSVGENIAHDLRTPIAVLRAKLERALDSDPRELRVVVRNSLSDLDRTMSTVTALLRISEVESGRRRSYFTTVDLSVVCKEVFEIYEPLASAKSIVMTLDAPEPLFAFGDFDLLVETISNLVDNAIKFTPSGKDIKIVTRIIDERPVIQVADHGPGIAPEEHGSIFKRFYRSKSHREQPGVGFGLNIAATIAELHGFSLHVYDNCPGALFELRCNDQKELITGRVASKQRRQQSVP